MTSIEWTRRPGTTGEVSFSPDLSIRFWEYVDANPGDDCWWWLGGTFTGGYGQFRAGCRKVKAHRYAWALAHGSSWPDESLCVMHTCDNPLCVRPEHLVLGTNPENTADRHAKVRDAKGDHHGSKTKPHRTLRGERNRGGGNRLTSADVSFIRSSLATAVELAAAFRVSKSMVYQIRRREVWAHV